ncbi:MAG TPA: GntR family transcriptional regulator [Intrasporangium sp.]|uniref:GntR family transcriptional regulator n=1 Tax=Intrasporangium sp. TaxID=1925024 RepID=UPI002D795DC7|nr:GntR family transcriptional regulator [Intrasporangium sp.]HET7398564.1 GntR family transcriptional regulator [Intrasporangium sp.]
MHMPIEKVGEALLTDKVFATIRTSILNGELPAGYRLRIDDLAERVGTSHMPVREAIKRLEEAGLAERVPHRGAVVRGLTQQELLHVYAVRRVLEMEAARQGSERITSEDVEKMQVQYDEMRAAIVDKDAIAVLDRDEDFLTVLYQASGNPVLTSTIKGLWEQCRFYKIVGARVTLEAEDDSPLWRFQAELLEAARSRDANLAAEITSASLHNATARIRAQLTTDTSDKAEAAG